MSHRSNLAVTALALLLLLTGCGGAVHQNSSPPVVQVTAQQHRVAVVMLENTSYSDVIGSASMPYLNSLVAKYGLATNYFAVAHPSIGNYFMLTTGQLITNDDAYTNVVTDDNLARELASSGKTWKAYAESIPSPGYLGPDAFPYLRHHVPFTFFSDVVNDSAQAANIVPFPQLATDLQNGALPDLLFIVPNALNDIHSCPPANANCTLADREVTADQWLSTNIAPLLQDAQFQSDGLLAIVVDEARTSDSRDGGGQVACVLVGASVKPGYRATTFYQHENLLALIGNLLGLATTPGAGAGANNMGEFMQ